VRRLEAENIRAAKTELGKILESYSTERTRSTDFNVLQKLAPATFPFHNEVFDLTELTVQAIDFTRPFWEAYPQKRGFRVNLEMSLADGCFVRGNQSEIF